MPFDPGLNWLRDDVLAAGGAEGVSIERADDIFRPGVLLDQILDAINEADVVVAICTGKNANAFFELGYAWRSHSPVLLAESTADLPFDVAHYRTLIYGPPTPSLDRDDLRRRLAASIRGAIEAKPLPRGHRLPSAPVPKASTRLSADLQATGRNHRLVVSNTGIVEVHDVDVQVPEEATSLHLVNSGYLPVSILRPGERIKVPASVVMGGGASVFDIEVTGQTADGRSVVFPIKISL